MDEREKEKLSLSIYTLLRSIVNTVSFPTHDTIATTLLYSLGLFGVSAFSQYLGFYTFISWQGCIGCVIALLVLLWIERAQNHTLQNAYKRARIAAKQVKRDVKNRRSPIELKAKSTSKKSKKSSIKSSKKH